MERKKKKKNQHLHNTQAVSTLPLYDSEGFHTCNLLSLYPIRYSTVHMAGNLSMAG